MEIKLVPVTYDLCMKVADWRKQIGLAAYRTPYYLTTRMQEKFWNNVINNRNSNARFYAVETDREETNSATVYCRKLVGMVGLENIDYINGTAEISLVIDPAYHGRGIGKEAVQLIINIAFWFLRLNAIYGECYKCNPAIGFWERIMKSYNADIVYLPARKYYNGQLYDSMFFTLTKYRYEAKGIN